MTQVSVGCWNTHNCKNCWTKRPKKIEVVIGVKGDIFNEFCIIVGVSQPLNLSLPSTPFTSRKSKEKETSSMTLAWAIRRKSVQSSNSQWVNEMMSISLIFFTKHIPYQLNFYVKIQQGKYQQNIGQSVGTAVIRNNQVRSGTVTRYTKFGTTCIVLRPPLQHCG